MRVIKKAILLACFGTSSLRAKELTFDELQHYFEKAFPDYIVRQAWTSSLIRKRLYERDGIDIPGVEDALRALQAEGVERTVVVSVLMMPGKEYEKLVGICEKYRNVTVTEPFVTDETDLRKLLKTAVEFVYENIEETKKKDKQLVFMGHGSHNASQQLYDFDSQTENVYLASLEGEPSINSLIDRLDPARETILAPFLLVPGEHVIRDMAGDEEESWNLVLKKKGFHVTCFMRGLLECEKIRAILADRVGSALK